MQISSQLDEPGMYGVVHGARLDGTGHSFNVANLEGRVWWIDGQIGEMSKNFPYPANEFGTLYFEHTYYYNFNDY